MFQFLKRLFQRASGDSRTDADRLDRAVVGRNRAESSLRESEEHFVELVAGVRDYAVFLLDERGHVRTWNVGAERIKGYKAEDIIGQHFSRFYPNEAVSSG